jgi:hypothetical protein
MADEYKDPQPTQGNNVNINGNQPEQSGQSVDDIDYMDPNLGGNMNNEYSEETAAEVVPNIAVDPIRSRKTSDSSMNAASTNDTETATGGAGLGWLALALSIISLFVMPIVMGAAGIIIGFIARARGAKGLGAWAIGIGAASIIVGMFILPFF